ncbi:MAG: hypothetical protein QOE09_1438 [Ilumatobacteraceae bacterium]|jgi:hypothetical protein
MTYRRWIRVALAYLALVSLEIGVWAQFAPRSFYDQFPGLGRAWVRVNGPYNEHLVRDVGGLNLGLAAVLIVAIITLSRPTIIAAALASLLYGVPHLVYHIAHTDGLTNSDIAVSLGGLALFAALPILLIAVTATHRTDVPA